MFDIFPAKNSFKMDKSVRKKAELATVLCFPGLVAFPAFSVSRLFCLFVRENFENAANQKFI